MKKLLRLASVAVLMVAAFSCAVQTEPEPGDPSFVRDPSLNIANRSANNEMRSHNQGQNCMRCHQVFGPGIGMFSVAATIYNKAGVPVLNPTLELFDGPSDQGGKLVMTIKGDMLGNVFTTDALPLPDKDLWPVVKNADGTLVNNMPFPTGSGACNQCHRPDRRVEVLALRNVR
jgi:hypothetical protein